MVIAQHLKKRLPPSYVAGVRVHLGTQVEVAVGAFDRGEPTMPASGDLCRRLPLDRT